MKSGFERTTSRLRLLRPVTSDLGAAIAIHCDPETYEFSPTGAMPREHVEPMLRSWIVSWTQRGHGFWSVRRLGGDAIIGFGGVMPGPAPATEDLVLYYRFAPYASGFGYATEMAREALSVAFGLLDAPRVITKIRSANERSIHVAEKLGLRPGDSFEEDGAPFTRYSLTNPRHG